jgi:hypothetical protein
MKHNNKKAASLVVTLIVLAALAVVAVAMIVNTSLDRVAVTSSANIYRAQLAAEAGAASFASRIATLMSDRPLHSIGYLLEGGPDSVAHPVFFGAEKYSGEIPSTFLLNSSPEILSELPEFNDENAVNINVTESVAGERGWIGSPIRKINGQWVQTTPENKALWVNILADPERPNQPDPNLTSTYNPIVARYAYWVEDETAKINIRISGNNEQGGAFLRNSTASTNSTQLDIGAVPLDRQTTPPKPLPMGAGDSTANNAIVEFMRENSNFPAKYRMLSFIEQPPIQGIDEEDIKFHITYDSVSNELAGTGRRRANLNHIVTESLDPDKIAADLDDIIYVITGQHIFRGQEYHGGLSNAAHEGVFLNEDDQEIDTRAMPDFGKRFYTAPSVASGGTLKQDHEKTYLLKLAANIRDYVDSDSQPTFVDFSGEVQAGSHIETSWLTDAEPIALGKEAIPYFQEHVWYARLNNIDIVAGTAPSNRRRVEFTFDHYFEFYNPSTKAWTAPPGTRIVLKNLFEFDANQYGSIEFPLEVSIDLSNQVFPAGTAVVVTTMPEGEDPVGLLPAGATVIRGTVPNAARVFNEMGNAQVGSETGDSRRFGIRLIGRTSSETDYETEMALTTPNGVIEAFPFLSLAGSMGQSPFEMTRSVGGVTGTWALPAAQRERRFVWGHSLRGNDAPSRTGDPRSLSEPMELVGGNGTAFGNDQARFFNNFNGVSHNANPLPGSYSSGNPRITLGNPANPEYVNPVNWPDYHLQLSNSAANAYAVISDTAMKSIGELGHIYDPHRKLDPASNIMRARGGGRSLKIGQPDDLVANTRFSGATAANISWFNGSWRLTDIFSADDPALAESQPSAEGKINVNGVLRDNGTAFRAALRSLTFQPTPDGDPARAGRMLSESEIDQLISQMITYLQTNGPMLCRGELGQIPFFSAAGAAGTAGAHPSSTAMDRSREEIFRRVVELITTRSLSFKLYVIGQAVRQNLDGSVTPMATSYQQSRVKLEPEIEDQVNSRATGYKVKVVDTLSL